MERAGTFSNSNVVLTAGAGTATDEIDVAVSWVSGDLSNNESHPSRVVPITLVNGQVLRVTLSGLTPPNGTQPVHTQAAARYSTRVATGWNVYAGKRGGTLYKQNGALLGLAATYTATGDPSYSGTEAGLGQYADINLAIESNLRRC
jgi:hypothetical protein